MFRKLPTSVKVAGREYNINPDYRIFAQFEADAWREKVNVLNILRAFYHYRLPDDLDAATERFLWFYRCGDSTEDGKGQNNGTRGYDFEQDADALYQSFMQAYRIDLYAIRLHWWKFCNLIAGLPENTPFKQLIFIRTAEVSKMDKSRREAILSARAKCALMQGGEPQTVEEYESDMINKLRRAKKEAGI